MNKTIWLNLIYFFMLIMILSTMIFNKMPTTMMILFLILYTMITSMSMINLKSKTTYSFIMFLMIIGGLMILFMMFLSLISNEQSMIKLNKNNILFIILIIMLMCKPITENFYMNYLIELKMNSLTDSFYFMNINKLINYPNNFYSILLMILLLLILLLVTKLCSMNNKPLRKINN
uniref:NADH dehydrogenase subunit 6 n=1 Tax=Parapolybia tinctipennis TaxID=2592911 RepID=A0A514CQN9_9HYME|nr:NADH dehydrogenase subunit 6 [Parapolybia tinctipennis]